MHDPYKEVKQQIAKDRSLIYLDIETSPMTVYVWGLWEQRVSHDQIIDESKIISIQWMFEGDKKVSFLTWDPKTHDEKKMLMEFRKVMKDVKVAVMQNGKKFDYPTLRWRMNVLGLPPLKEVEIVDILSLSRAAFRAPSHKLDYRSKIYGLGGKINMSFKDWKNVKENKPGALSHMIKYGCKDIPDTRHLFWRELPSYVNMQTSLAALVGKSRDFCSKCASKRQRRFDIFPTKIGNKCMMKCEHCGNMWKDTRLVKEEQSLFKLRR